MIIGTQIVAGVVTAIIALFSMKSEYRGEIFTTYKNWVFAFTFNPVPEVIRGHGFLSPPATAFYLNSVIAFTFAALLLCKKNIYRLLFATLLIVLFTGHLSTLCKGSILGLFGIATVFILNHKSLKTRVIFSYAAFFFLILVGFIISHFEHLKRTLEFSFMRTMSSTSGATSVSYRFEFWKKGFERILETYGMGMGMGGLQHEFIPWPHAHSIYFSALFDLGFIGLGIWLVLLTVVLKKALEVYRTCTDEYYKTFVLGFLAGLVGILINGLTDFEYVYGMIWLYLGIGAAIIKLAKYNSTDMVKT
jgi:O-antigen ligase